jgi:hypothetical protein
VTSVAYSPPVAQPHTLPPRPTAMPVPTVEDFLAANRRSGWGSFNPQNREASFHTQPRMFLFATQFPHLKDEGWLLTYMFPVRKVNFLLTWDNAHNETATVTLLRDGALRQYNASHNSVARLRRLWQDTPMVNRGLTPVGRGSANYFFEW